MHILQDLDFEEHIPHNSSRILLSVKYIYSDANETTENSNLCEGFEYLKTENGYHIFENTNYIPMGFTFTKYITEDQYYSIHESLRSEVLVSSIVLNESQAKLYGHYLEHELAPEKPFYYEDFQQEVRYRNISSSYKFTYDEKGFTSKIYLTRDNLVFFSVPYEKGWTAYVNGKETVIEKVDVGFMAVFAESGFNEIVFVYETPGLKAGAIISGISLIALAVYWFFFRFEQKRRIDDYNLMSEYLGEKDTSEKELSPEEDLTIVRSPADVPPYREYKGPQEKIFPEL
jgi:hypothetical protein